MATLITTVGLTKINSATPLAQLNITHMAIGDGNGGTPSHTAADTTLNNEVYRTAASTPIRDPQNPDHLIFDMNIPDDVRGFTVREVGLFDSDGDLIAVGATQVTDKGPDSRINLTERMVIRLQNANDVNVIYNSAPPTDYEERLQDIEGKYAQHMTLAQAQASDLREGQYVRLVDRGLGLFRVHPIGTVSNGFDSVGLPNGLVLVLSELGNIFVVDWFGAKGQSGEDDTAAIQAAVNYKSGAVVIGCGGKEYEITHIDINNPVTLSDIRLASTVTNIAMLDINSDRVTITRVVADGRNLNVPYDPNTVGSDTLIQCLETATGAGYDAIRITDCVLFNAGRDCIYINNQNGRDTVIANNNLLGASRNAISIVSSDGGVIEGNTIRNWGLVGIDLETNPLTIGEVHNYVVDGNVLDIPSNSNGAGISLGIGTGNGEETGSDVVVSNNIIRGNSDSNSQASVITNKDFKRLIITGNIVRNCAGGITNSAEDALIFGNMVTGGNAFAPTSLTSKGAIRSAGKIESNIIHDYPFFGIIAEGDVAHINDNVIYNVGSNNAAMSAIYLYDSLGTYSDASIGGNKIKNCERGIYVRNSTGLSLDLVGNSFNNVTTDVLSSTSNIRTRLDHNAVVLTNLPTTAPTQTGALWNDAGTVKVV